MQDYLDYDTNLTESAKRFRKNPTPAEKKIWLELLKNKNLRGHKFTRQKPIHYYVLDFYCAKLKLGIEIDGKIHDKLTERDAERTLDLESFGVKIIRYTNTEVMNKLDEVEKNLLRQMDIRAKELSN